MANRVAQPIPTKAVRLEVFDIQGHNGDFPLDYSAFFAALAGLEPSQRREQIADRIIALPIFESRGRAYSFVAYIGSPDTSFLVLDLNDDTEELRQLEDGQLIATRTVGIIDPEKRIAVVQYVHRGVRAAQVATLLEKLAQVNLEEYEKATLEFALRPGAAFRQQIAALDRIQSASLTITRPNADWTDFSDTFNELAGDSNAHNVAIAASASRDSSLAKNTGVVRLITELSRTQTRSILKSAKVKGTSEDTGEVREVKLNKNVESISPRVTLDGSLPNPAAVANAAEAYLESRDGDATQ